VLQTNLVDIDCHYHRDVSCLASLGGHLMQIYYILEEIIKKYP